MTPATPSALDRSDSQRRLRAAGSFLLFILLYVLFLFGFIALASLLGSLVPELGLPPELAGFPAVTLATALMLAAVDRRPPNYVGLGLGPGWFRQLAGGFALGLAMIFAVACLEWATGHLRISRSGVSTAEAAGGLLLWFFIFLVAAAHEEMVFRGYPFQRLVELLGAPVAVLLLAVAFGAIHLGNPHAGLLGALNTALVGIFFALAYLKTRQLWLPIGLHWGWNFFEAAFGFPVSGRTIGEMPLAATTAGREWFHGGGYGPEASLLASGVLLAGTAVLWWWGKRRQALAPSNEVA